MTGLDDWQVLVTSSLRAAAVGQKQRRRPTVARLCFFGRLLRTLLLHVGCGWSLRETAVQAKLAGIAEVSDVTLLNRLRDAESWLRQCARSFGRKLRAVGAELGRPDVRLLDATVVREPGKTAVSGGSITACAAKLECDQFELTATCGTGGGALAAVSF